MKIVIASGYFNPIHSGHISYLEEAQKLGDRLFVFVNNDEQVKLKGSKPFMTADERLIIVEALRCVNRAFLSGSRDSSVCYDLENMRMMFPYDELIFAKGGDRNIDNIPEVNICKEKNIKMVFGVGCEKTQSSSALLNLL